MFLSFCSKTIQNISKYSYFTPITQNTYVCFRLFPTRQDILQVGFLVLKLGKVIIRVGYCFKIVKIKNTSVDVFLFHKNGGLPFSLQVMLHLLLFYTLEENTEEVNLTQTLLNLQYLLKWD